MDEIFHKIVDDNWYILNVNSDGTIDRPFIEKSGRLLAKEKVLTMRVLIKFYQLFFQGWIMSKRSLMR